MSDLFFLPGPHGALACRRWPGQSRCRPVLLLAPLHEELNRSRLQLRLIGDHLQAHGHEVLLGDLSGTGDSDGEFGEATLSRWRADIDTLLAHMQSRHERPPTVVGLRGGALLIPAGASHWIAGFPLASGRAQIQQWLRQRLYVGRFKGEDIDRDRLLALWREQGIEIAGYALSPALLAELEAARLPKPAQAGGHAHVIEWQQPHASPPFARDVATGALGWQTLSGPAFWQTPETTAIAGLPEAIAAGIPA